MMKFMLKPKLKTTPKGPRPYDYQSLPTEEHIRLLRLQPGLRKDPLVASLEIYHIDECPNYAAVSYTWGTLEATHEIRMTSIGAGLTGSQALKIRPNLCKFLSSLRQFGHDRLLWVDAICINQQSYAEKSHQVRLMGKIYQIANKVEANLESDLTHSHEARHIRQAFEFMQMVTDYKLPTRDGVIDPSLLKPAQHYLNLSPHVEELWSRWKLNLWHDDVWSYLEQFSEQPYWSRKWIIQEIVVAKTVVLHIDGATCPMKVVEDFFDRINGNPYGFHTELTRLLHLEWDCRYAHKGLFSSPVSKLARHRLSQRTGASVPRTMHELLPRYASSKCGEQSDHAYALINLMGAHREHFEVDYSQHYTHRVAKILHFLRDFDGVDDRDIAAWAVGLLAMLKDTDQAAPGRPEYQARQCSDVRLEVVLTKMVWIVQLEEESMVSHRARLKVPAIRAVPNISSFAMGASTCSAIMTHPRSKAVTSPQDQVFFSIEGTSMFGLADGLRPGDRLCQVPATGLLFVVRQDTKAQLKLVGRAIIFYADDVAKDEQLDLAHMRRRLSSVSSDAAGDFNIKMPDDLVLELAGMALELGVQPTETMLPDSPVETLPDTAL